MRQYIIYVILTVLLAFFSTAAIVENLEIQNSKQQVISLHKQINSLQEEVAKSKQENKLSLDKQSLLKEFDNCVNQAHITYRIQWNRACNDHPWSKNKDGTCHELDASLASSIDDHHKERTSLCEMDYRNKMQALGIRQ